MSNFTRYQALTPCAGRCSTVFGDSVCRGCLRYSQEVIDWNRYGEAEHQLIWHRLDSQVDQIVLPLIPVKNMLGWQLYRTTCGINLPSAASEGRWRYEVFKTCVRKPQLIELTGLDIDPAGTRLLWHTVEKRLYALAVAMYELAWLRAATIVTRE